jgi:hypothetical protein
VPSACTLPTAEQPLRVAEFDALFATATSAERVAPGELRFALPPDIPQGNVTALSHQPPAFASFAGAGPTLLNPGRRTSRSGGAGCTGLKR